MDIALPAVFPVIHPVSQIEAFRSAEVAVEEGAAGVFLIDQGMRASQVLVLAQVLRRAYPKLVIGVNILQAIPIDVVLADLRRHGVQMLWGDQAPIHHPVDRERFREARQASGWIGPYFGGIAFKYRDAVPRELIPAAIAEALYAPAVVDVVTTSGEATGSPPDFDKVRLFRETLDKLPSPDGAPALLAIASGMTPENVASYVRAGVDATLVATGIEETFGRLDRMKTRDFIATVAAAPRSGRVLTIPEA